MREEYYIIAFDSINYANYLESELKKYDQEVEIIQTPQYLTNEYHIALKIKEEILEIAHKKIIENNFKPFKIYKHYLKNKRKIFKAVKLEDEEFDEEFDMFYDTYNISEENNLKDTKSYEVEETSKKENEKQNRGLESNLEIKEGTEEKDEISNKLVSDSLNINIENKRKRGSDPVEIIRKLYKLSQKK